ncbi:unnamed protein product [Cyprideis torosa]|uniref:Uncharacterized protein n=1 Tax=Cyprideis torosa TaxID=163714 RepID=A0A7R8ZRG5_9CRUS|nr:unnamed protein product [Cyprideis torosa]CAG0892997.1 unnamed protein product [Cyprideis torosa]
MNGATPLLDIGHIYGNDKKKVDSLRTFEDGRMKSTVLKGYYELMPQCEKGVPDGCFETGDFRYDVVPALALHHTLHLRSHNRLAHALQQMNPHWNDERLFQEARRINIAVHQHVTFNEYLPIVIGTKYMKSRGMKPFSYGNSSYRMDYDSYLNPNTFNEFSAAAFRLHSQIPGRWSLIDGKTHEYFFLRDHMLNSSMMFSENNVDAQIRGMLFQQPQRTDPFFSVEVTNFLFRGNEPFGLDLAALDIQRGRDHGIPPWNELRKLCGLSPVDTWTDVAQHMGTKYVDLLRSVYSHPHDIDFWVGGTLEEERLGGALVGPSFMCIIGEQFFRKQRGDRFYYEYQSAGFTPEQLASIRRTSLASFLCFTSDTLRRASPFAYFQAGPGNEEMDCSYLPHVDLSHWKDYYG